jgi:hypothetical protein
MTVKVLRFSYDIDSDIRRGWSAYGGLRFDTEEEARSFFDDETGSLNVCFDADRDQYGVVHHDGLSCFVIEEDEEEIADADYIRKHATLTQAEYTIGKVKVLESYGDDWHLLECESYGKESLD